MADAQAPSTSAAPRRRDSDAEQAAHPATRRRRRGPAAAREPDDEGPPRQLWSAGHALVVWVARARDRPRCSTRPGSTRRRTTSGGLAAGRRARGHRAARRRERRAAARPAPRGSSRPSRPLGRRRDRHAIGLPAAGDDAGTRVAPKPTAVGATPASCRAKKLAFTPKKKLRLWVAGDSLVDHARVRDRRAAGASPVLEPVG